MKLLRERERERASRKVRWEDRNVRRERVRGEKIDSGKVLSEGGRQEGREGERTAYHKGSILGRPEEMPVSI